MSVKNLLRRSIASFAYGAALSVVPNPNLAFTAAGPALAQADATTHVDLVSCAWDACGWAWGPAAVINDMIAGSDIGRHAVVTPSPYLHYPAYYDGQRHDEEQVQYGCRRRRVGPDGHAHWRRSC